MVDEYEGTDKPKMTIRQGFRIGWSRTSVAAVPDQFDREPARIAACAGSDFLQESAFTSRS